MLFVFCSFVPLNIIIKANITIFSEILFIWTYFSFCCSVTIGVFRLFFFFLFFQIHLFFNCKSIKYIFVVQTNNNLKKNFVHSYFVIVHRHFILFFEVNMHLHFWVHSNFPHFFSLTTQEKLCWKQLLGKLNELNDSFVEIK